MVKKTRTLDLNDNKRVIEKEMEEKLSVLKGDVQEVEKPKSRGRKRLETVVAETINEPVAEPIAEPVAKPIAEPVVEDVPKPMEKPIMLEETTKAYFEEMMTNYLKNYKPPIIEPPNVVEKKTRVKKTAVVEVPNTSTIAKTTNRPRGGRAKTVIEEANNDMLRAEYEKELRRRMMNTLFDY